MVPIQCTAAPMRYSEELDEIVSAASHSPAAGISPKALVCLLSGVAPVLSGQDLRAGTEDSPVTSSWQRIASVRR